MEWIQKVSPCLKARIAGGFYLLAIVAGIVAVMAAGSLGSAALSLATLCNIAVALLFYELFRPVNQGLSFLAALCGLASSILGSLRWHPLDVDIGMIFFGLYCLLIGVLILRSTFLPRILGVLMALAGLGWLTLLSPTLERNLSPLNMAFGILGQVALTLWLLIAGVNAQRWQEQAGRTSTNR